MKRWAAGFLIVMAACLGLFFTRSTDPSLLQDTDTQVLIAKIRDAGDPLRWFAGDWPLENHFYRPISTLAFEMDNAIFRDAAWGYGLTNVLLAIASSLCLFWLLRELTDNLPLTTASTLVFIAWQAGVDLAPWWLTLPLQIATVFLCAPPKWRLMPLVVLAVVVAFQVGDIPSSIGQAVHQIAEVLPTWIVISFLVLGIAAWTARDVRAWVRWAVPVFLLALVVGELSPHANLHDGTIAWIPGRTATVMAMFVLISLAAYARFERLGADRTPPEPDPLAPPATRGTKVVVRRQGGHVGWLAVSVAALVLALGSYEQAVMGPALLLAVAVTFRLQRFRVRWWPHALFWLALVGYLVLRAALVPRDISTYQNQALRFGPGVGLEIGNYALPAVGALVAAVASLSVGPAVLLGASFYSQLTVIGSNLAAIVAFASRRSIFVWTGYGMSVLAFLPMAWLVRFNHYHYLPMAFRALFAVAIAVGFGQALASAVSPPSLQAPRRLAPAPGSLPRP